MSTLLEIRGRETDLGGLVVRRLLPDMQRRCIGPFIFLDHFGPVHMPPGTGMDVRPHPHIGLATVTYLFEGEILHRDSLGSVQPIRPGAVNLMVAGRGIAHSERTDAALRSAGARLHGLQCWLALPAELEQQEPSFAHHAAETLPQVEHEGAGVRVILGRLLGAQSPVVAAGGPLYAEIRLPPAGAFSIPDDGRERALYPIDAEVRVDGAPYPARHLLLLPPGPCRLEAPAGGLVMLLGGEPLAMPPRVWWNFAARDPARIEQAKRDWSAQRFARVPGETEYIPLPSG